MPIGRAAIALTVAALAASACPAGAEAAGWPLAISSAGFCVPAPEDPGLVPRAVGSLALGAPATRPVAILDTGVDASRPDLAGRVLPGLDAISGGPVSGDTDGHGTQLAGIVSASGAGLQGVSPRSPILPVRIFGPDRTTTADLMAKGIAFAVQQGAGVVLLGGSAAASDASPGPTARVRTAIDAAFAAGALVVAPAGDNSVADPSVPGALPHVVEVGGANAQNLRSGKSNFGPWLDLLAPGEGVYGPLPQAGCAFGYGFSTGSEFAAAAVAGAAAGLQALRPTLNVQQLFEVVRRAAVDLGPTGRDDDTGFGFLNAAAGQSAAPQAKETSPEVDDDPFWVRGKYAKDHPPLVTAKKLRFKVVGAVSPTKDPADVYPIRLARRQRVVVTLNAADRSASLGLSILRSTAGDFDVTDGVASHVAVGTDGLSYYARLELTAKSAATFFIAVESQDPIDPEDPTAVAPTAIPYELSAFSQIRKPRKRR